MNYSPLFMISLKHTFYDNGKCPAFSVTANTQTEKLLKNHRCVIKPDADGLCVYVPVDKQIPLISFDKNDQFFICKLTNSRYTATCELSYKVQMIANFIRPVILYRVI
ncbi:MAG: hypothetical protein PHY16_11595 [Methylobacter sp.]|nr:hypothetical protein [Methylobacter sp.]